ncbi:MAG TPA: methylated-DNA--[protein]-cysteine S-methyltransferase [Anaerolinea sp.]|nr:methylated-DNA--[protein]-cysteine S-methyltransferase [Anaerolinea sp.]
MQPALFSSSKTLWSGRLSSTPIGPVWAAVSSLGLARVSIGAPLATTGEGHAPETLASALEQLREYFQRRRERFDLPVDWSGLAPFNLLALQAAAHIPYGQVRTYAQLAEQIGRPDAARAVGGAMAANPLPIVVPCHRVIGSDGKLHGYAAPDGIQTKAYLLRLEGGLAV